MEKSRQMDKVQNQNARYLDQFGKSNKTSVKTTNPPGKLYYNNQEVRAHSHLAGLSQKSKK
jgi:hypothetical protein